jgi:tetratricopeptide (TPR) repeat protein/tRNA A-37 threonylcarbamoyl transferase component Bud32
MDTPASPKKLAGRYEVREILGQGGMGLVYRAYDTVVRREVAVKTILDIPDPASLQLFYKECDVLASMSHPNIVEIFDIGEFEEDGKKKPYFVMPLLPGTTLEHFIRKASHRLTVERTIDIISQACRGLQAAHERGLVHRDLKPSNIFVMEDDSVKIIDFGVAHMADAHTTRAQKGTLLYMSPEQIELKPLTAASDIFSLSVVSYEAMTGRNPFQRARADEVVEAILHQIPPLAAELNSSVSQPVSRVLHKAMAKQSWHRFASARDFGDTLNKALRNEPIEFFDPERTRPRLQRATKALEEGDFQFAGEILGELEAEGHMDNSIGALRRQLDGAVRRKTLSQLLEAARARFEEEEDPLALQKLQEALQIEPDNATALALKIRIENRRSERQIDNWYRLARQHIDNNAYAHAREALQNVLQLRPKEARALQLLAEVDRLEQEYKKLRQEKEKLHHAAMDAWQKGDVSSALAKLGVVLELDRRAPDSVNRESGTTYQSFYNEVRSEHDAMNTAYADARRHLTERNFTKAMNSCQAYLAKYPDNAIFQALKYDIEEHQRQELSALVASVDRQVEAEPDLDRKVNILREALNLHPGESHFEGALRLVQDKRDLVNSIVARAHLHEEQAAFSDALNDWEILRTIYSQYPGLTFEVERLQKRRDQQIRIESKTRLVEQIDTCLHSSDYVHALDLLHESAAEFPHDEELTQLEKLAEDGVKRKTEAHRLMTEGQELCAQQKPADGIKLLREAYELDENNSLSRAVLANALVEQARSTVETDWRESEKLAREALDLNPGHPMAKTIRSLILDQKRETFVDECVSQSRKLQSAADLAGALSRIEEGLSVYPREPRLIQIQEIVQRDLQTQRRQTRRRDLEELRSMQSEVDSATDATSKQAVGDRVRAVADKYSNDGEVLSVANGFLIRLGLLEVKGKSPTESPDSQSPTQTINNPTSSPTESLAGTGTMTSNVPGATLPVAGQPVAPAVAAPPPPPPPAVPPVAASSAKPPARAPAAAASVSKLKQPAKSSQRYPTAVVAAASAAAIVIVIVAILLFARKHPAPPIAQTPEAAPSASSTAQSPAASPLAVLKLTSDAGTGKVTLDDQPPVEFQDGQWSLDKLSAGEHKLKIEGQQGGASFTFSTEAGARPVVKGPIVSRGTLAVLVSSRGDSLHVYSSDSSIKVSVDGQPPADVPKEGLEVPSITAGAHELAVIRGNDQHQYKFDTNAGAAPMLNAFLESGQDLGALVVVTGQEKAKVFLNGTLQQQLTEGGQLRIPNLELKEYVVRVSKAGFQEVPEQKIRLRKGEPGKLTFNLQPIPRLASLNIQGGVPGATVLIDQTQVGTVRPDGTLTVAMVNPGDHIIELRKDRFKPKQIKRSFVAGAAVSLAAADAALDAAPGELKITFTPADAQVTLGKAGESAAKVNSGSTLSLPAGSYTLTAKIADLTRSSTVEVTAGQSKSLDLSLGPSGMSKWDNPAGWKQEKGSFVHKGGDFVLFGVTPTSGTFIFSAMLSKGHRLQWVLNCIDANNYVLFQMDENNFYRTVVRNGQKGDETKVPHKVDKKSFRTLQIRVRPNEITHQIRQGDNWVVLDRWTQTGSNLSLGKFGFLIPGNDQVALSSFGHYLDLDAR